MTRAPIASGGVPPGAGGWPRALQGDARALEVLAAGSGDVLTWLVVNKILGAVACRAREASIELPPAWRHHLRHCAAQGIVFDRAFRGIGATLDASGVPWCPIKGMDLRSRLYRWPEERPMGDIDVLVGARDFERARLALLGAGWRDRCEDEAVRRYDREEGYNWQALDSSGILLELHFRLWGILGEGFAAEVLSSATPDPGLGSSGLRPSWPHAFTLTAVHCWNNPAPRAARQWWEIHLLSQQGGEEMVSRVIEIARRWGLELPIAGAAATVCGLWPESPCRAIGDGLRPHFRLAERVVWWRAARRGMDLLGWREIYLARLLARRPTRMGWRAPLRRIWDHPGIVAETTPASWPWWRRRGLAVARHLGLFGGRWG